MFDSVTHATLRSWNALCGVGDPAQGARTDAVVFALKDQGVEWGSSTDSPLPVFVSTQGRI